MIAATDSGKPADVAVSMTLEGSEARTWRGHPDPTVDVAVLIFSEFIYAIQQPGTAPFWRAFNLEDFATSRNRHLAGAFDRPSPQGGVDGDLAEDTTGRRC